MLAIVVGFNSAKSNASEVTCLYAGPSRQEARTALNKPIAGIVRTELYVNPMYHERGKFGAPPVIEQLAEGDEGGKKEEGANDLVSALAEIVLQNEEINRLIGVLAEKDKEIEGLGKALTTKVEEIADLKTTLADVNQLAEERSVTIASQERDLIALRAKVSALEAAGETKTISDGDKPSTEASGEAGGLGGTSVSLEPGASAAGVSTDASAPSGGNLPLGLPDKAGKKK